MKSRLLRWVIPILLMGLVGTAWGVLGIEEKPRGISTPYWYGYSNGTPAAYYLAAPALSVNDTAVGLAATQTLTNKTLTSPTVTGGTFTTPSLSAPVITSAPTTTDGIGAKNGSTVTATEYGNGVIHKTILTLAATPISISDDAGVAQYGGVKIYDFPEGGLVILGAVVNANATLGVTGTIINTWAGGVALGTATATTGATLTGTEADIMPEVDVAAATAKVASINGMSVATALTESGARWFNGTSTAKDLYLNLVVDDDASHTAGTGTITGTVTITWINLGDY